MFGDGTGVEARVVLEAETGAVVLVEVVLKAETGAVVLVGVEMGLVLETGTGLVLEVQTLDVISSWKVAATVFGNTQVVQGVLEYPAESS